MRYVIALLCLLLSHSASAQQSFTPYYASLKSKADIANIRTGPSKKYPIVWVYQRPHWPMKIVATFEGWRKVEDIHGEVGWIHKSLLSGKHYVIIQTKGVQEIRRLDLPNASVNFIAENGVIAELLYCKKNKWCRIMVDERKGWVEGKYLWGVGSDWDE